LSCLQSLQNRDLSHLIGDILCCVHGLLSGGTIVVFMWVPSQSELAGNWAADIAAKATLLPVYNLTVPQADYNSLICTRVGTQTGATTLEFCNVEQAASNCTKSECN